uniref:Fish-egg lectin-like n=1 Tax=Haplochromis burtoni TaxID=8153 RepID=A0A3Q2VMY9_HAPBU
SQPTTYILFSRLSVALSQYAYLCVLAFSCTCDTSSGPQQFPAVQIDAGQGNVVMTDSNNYAYFLLGSQWYKMGSLTLKHVSVGPAGIWGVALDDRVYKYVAGSFVFANGQTLQQVDAGGDGQVVGVTDTSTIHCLKSTIASDYRKQSTLSWTTITGGLMYVSCSSKYGCWGVNSTSHHILDGLAVKVETGTDGSVFVVTKDGEVFQSSGKLPGKPGQTHSSNVSACYKSNTNTPIIGQ